MRPRRRPDARWPWPTRGLPEFVPCRDGYRRRPPSETGRGGVHHFSGSVDEPVELVTQPGFVGSTQIYLVTDLVQGDAHCAHVAFRSINVVSLVRPSHQSQQSVSCAGRRPRAMDRPLGHRTTSPQRLASRTGMAHPRFVPGFTGRRAGWCPSRRHELAVLPRPRTHTGIYGRPCRALDSGLPTSVAAGAPHMVVGQRLTAAAQGGLSWVRPDGSFPVDRLLRMLGRLTSTLALSEPPHHVVVVVQRPRARDSGPLIGASAHRHRTSVPRLWVIVRRSTWPGCVCCVWIARAAHVCQRGSIDDFLSRALQSECMQSIAIECLGSLRSAVAG